MRPKKKGIEPREFTVASDGLAVVVNRKNPIDQLTVDEIADIFTGKIRNDQLLRKYFVRKGILTKNDLKIRHCR